MSPFDEMQVRELNPWLEALSRPIRDFVASHNSAFLEAVVKGMVPFAWGLPLTGSIEELAVELGLSDGEVRAAVEEFGQFMAAHCDELLSGLLAAADAEGRLPVKLPDGSTDLLECPALQMAKSRGLYPASMSRRSAHSG